MDQGVIQSLKAKYQKQIIQRLIRAEQNHFYPQPF